LRQGEINSLPIIQPWEFIRSKYAGTHENKEKLKRKSKAEQYIKEYKDHRFLFFVWGKEWNKVCYLKAYPGGAEKGGNEL